jgi:transcription initiation factor TFIID subunit TAF12
VSLCFKNRSAAAHRNLLSRIQQQQQQQNEGQLFPVMTSRSNFRPDSKKVSQSLKSFIVRKHATPIVYCVNKNYAFP